MKKAIIISFIIIIGIQFISIKKINKTDNKELEIQAPKQIHNILKKACYDCHSNDTTWPWYSDIAPFSWLIVNHVEDGRKALNFSIWQKYDEEKKKEKLKAIFRTVYASMPLKSYICLHEEANLRKEERSIIRDWTGVKK